MSVLVRGRHVGFFGLTMALAPLSSWPEGQAPKCGPKVSRPITPTKAAAFDNAMSRGAGVPSVILCRPFDDGNVGGSARAMLNFGLWDLRVVPQPDGLGAKTDSDEALLRASGAAPILRRCESHETAASAVQDLNLVLATTARMRDARIPVYSPREAVALAADAIARGEKVGLMFGSEKNGLSNAELEHATGLITIPTNPGFGSLNLAQAVLLMCYEWGTSDAGQAMLAAKSAAAIGKPSHEVEDGVERATQGQLESLFEFWEASLWQSSFFGGNRAVLSSLGPEEGRKQEQIRARAAMGKLRRLILRGDPDKGEADLLRGSLRSLVNAMTSSDTDHPGPQDQER